MKQRLAPPAAFVAALLATGSLARAQDVWTLRTADLSSRQGRLARVDGRGVTIAQPSTQPAAAVPLADVVSLTRGDGDSARVPAVDALVLHLANGDRLVGRPASTADEKLTWASPALGERTVPLTQLTAITRGPAPVSKLDRPAAEDVVRLLNGDVVRGIITEVTADALTVAAGDASTPLQVASIASVRFATAGAEATVRPAFRVALDDGSAASADAIAFDGATWTLSAANQPDAQVSSARVVAIDHLAGPLAWLSSLPPAEQVYTPYLTEQFPPRLDQSVTGGPIQFGEQTFARGIGVHARTTLTWEMGTAGYGTFRTRYAVADGAPLASPVVRVRVDGNVVHEATARPGDLSAVVTADVSTARTLTLEVDFSPAGHATQARVNWIEPALLRGPVR